MSNKNNHHEMAPISGEAAEVEGVYKNQWGRVEKMDRGEILPADPMLGTTEWVLVEYDFETNHEGRTDPQLIPDDGAHNPEAHMQHPRRHEGSNKTDDDNH